MTIENQQKLIELLQQNQEALQILNEDVDALCFGLVILIGLFTINSFQK